jgi:hypothetical protein
VRDGWQGYYIILGEGEGVQLLGKEDITDSKDIEDSGDNRDI